MAHILSLRALFLDTSKFNPFTCSDEAFTFYVQIRGGSLPIVARTLDNHPQNPRHVDYNSLPSEPSHV